MKTTLILLIALTVYSCQKKETTSIEKPNHDSLVKVISKQVDSVIAKSQEEVNYVLGLIKRKDYLIAANNKIVNAYNSGTGELSLEEVETKVKEYDIEIKYIDRKLQEITDKN